MVYKDGGIHGRLLLLVVAATLLCAVALWALPADAQPDSLAIDQGPITDIYISPRHGSAAPPAAPAYNLLDEIKRAQAFLQNRSVGYIKQSGKRKVTIVDRRGRKS